MAAKKRRSRKVRPASLAYTVSILILMVGAVFLVLSLYGLFSPEPSKEGVTKVLVRNGCGVEGVGLRTKRFLAERGHDVVDFRNADSFDYEETIVIDRAGDLDRAVEIARLLRAHNAVQQVQEAPYVDVEVIVGKDYEKFLTEP